MKKRYFSYKIVSLTVLSMTSFSSGYAGPGHKPSYFTRDRGSFEDDMRPRKTYSTVRLRSSTFLSRSYGTWGRNFPNDLMGKRPSRRAFIVASTLGAAIGIGAYFSNRTHGELDSAEIDSMENPETKKVKKYPYFFLQKKDKDESARTWNFSTVYAESRDLEEKTSQQAAKETDGNPPQSSTEKVNGIRLEIEKVNNLLKKQKVEKEVTILIGRTDAGKSVIYNYLQGIPLEAIMVDGKLVIQVDGKANILDKENGKIVHGKKSGTTYPSTNGTFFDCPGFADTRGSEQDIVNAYSLYKLFDQVQNFKLVLVVNRAELEASRGRDFVKVIGQIEEMFPDKIDEIKKGLHLIVTKGTKEENNEKRVKSEISMILRDYKGEKGFTSFQADLLQHLIKEEGKITCFESPPGPCKIKGGIKLINGGSFIRKITPNISVEAETRGYITDLAETLAKESSSLLSSFQGEFKEHARSFTKSKEKKAQELRNSFQTAISKLNDAQQNTQGFEDSARKVRKVLQKFDKGDLPAKFFHLADQRNFLKSITPQGHSINLDLNTGGTLLEIVRTLQPYSDKAQPDYNEGSLKFTGYIIGTSDITSSLKDRSFSENGVSQVSAYAMSSMLIDDNITAPGTTLALISPLWKVIGERIIDLQGKDVGSHLSQALKETNGEPGDPGESGGNFDGFVDDLQINHSLTINVSGGKGGKGQDGGDGRNGNDGIEGNKTDVEARDVKLIVGNEPITHNRFWKVVRAPFVANKGDRITYKSGADGTKGGDAGTGGKGGLGGQSGLVRFADTHFNQISQFTEKYPNITIIVKNGEEGEGGKPGEPGPGGKNGKVFKGIYIDKSISGQGLFWRALGEGAAGAGAGLLAGSWTGPGALISAGIGGVAGVLTPILATEGDDLVNGGWEEGPSMMPYVEFANKGTIRSDFNPKRRETPKKSKEIKEREIRENWKNLCKKFHGSI